MLFWDNLNKRPLCHNLSKVLEISRKTLLTSYPSSNDKKILCVMNNSWLMQEPLGLNSYWHCEIRLFSSKKINSLLKISLSSIFPHIGNNETGGNFLGFSYRLKEHGFPFSITMETNHYLVLLWRLVAFVTQNQKSLKYFLKVKNNFK